MDVKRIIRTQLPEKITKESEELKKELEKLKHDIATTRLKKYYEDVKAIEIYAIENVDFKYEIKNGYISYDTDCFDGTLSALLDSALFDLKIKAYTYGATTIIGLKYSIASRFDNNNHTIYSIYMTGAAVKRIEDYI